MARDFASASSEYIENASAIVADAPFTVSFWGNIDGVASNEGWFSLSSTSDPDDQHTIMTLSGTPNVRSRSTSDTGGSFTSAAAPSAMSAGSWHNIVGLWTSTSSRTCYIDGSGGTADTTAITGMATLNVTGFGRLSDSTPSSYINGMMAECGMWNVALTAAEIASLAEGVSPLFIRPASLVGYWPLIGNDSPEIDLVGGNDMTLGGTPTAVAHPAVMRPSAQILQFPPSAAAPPSGSTSLTLLGVG